MSMIIACNECAAEFTSACGECVVPFVLRADRIGPMALDYDEERVISLFAKAGLVPKLRFVAS